MSVTGRTAVSEACAKSDIDSNACFCASSKARKIANAALPTLAPVLRFCWRALGPALLFPPGAPAAITQPRCRRLPRSLAALGCARSQPTRYVTVATHLRNGPTFAHSVLLVSRIEPRAYTVVSPQYQHTLRPLNAQPQTRPAKRKSRCRGLLSSWPTSFDNTAPPIATRTPAAPQLRVLRAVEICRTAALGGHVEQCCQCQHTRITYNSCRNRHCPKCQNTERERWVKPRNELLPVEYFHVVFTVPAQIAELLFYNQE